MGLKLLKNEIYSNLSDDEKSQLAVYLVIKFSCEESNETKKADVKVEKVQDAVEVTEEKVEEMPAKQETVEEQDPIMVEAASEVKDELQVVQSDVKKDSDWVTESSQVAEVINTSDFKSEVVFTTDVHHFKEASVQEPSFSDQISEYDIKSMQPKPKRSHKFNDWVEAEEEEA